MKKILLLSLFTFTTLAGHADEGMWMLTDLKEQNAATMYDMGCLLYTSPSPRD